MAYTLSTLEKDGYLHFLVTGENSPESVASYLEECLSICRRKGVRIMLVEDALVGPDLDLDPLFQVIGKAADLAAGVIDLGCYVKTTPGHNAEIVRYGENIAANRRVNVHGFRTVDEAANFIAEYRKISSG
ncbi:MAG TPA: hypothetical protein VGA56_18615 [Opitutaceae bacterium]